MNYTTQVKKLNPANLPMNECDYYKFMHKNGFIDNRIDAKKVYLKNRFGFIVGKDKIDTDVINLLNYIGTQYFYCEVLPKTDNFNTKWQA